MLIKAQWKSTEIFLLLSLVREKKLLFSVTFSCEWRIHFHIGLGPQGQSGMGWERKVSVGGRRGTATDSM